MNHKYKTYAGPQAEKNDGITLTVPDQAMSMREILDRFARGIPMESGRIPIYTDEEDLDDQPPIVMERLDLAEKEAISIHVGKTLKENRKRKEQPLKSQTEAIEPAAAATLT